MLLLGELYRQCAAQSVTLYGDLKAPINSFQASYDAGWMIWREEALSSSPIEDVSFCTNAVSLALTTIINSSHNPDTTLPLRTQQRVEALVGCSDAEDRIGDGLAA